MSAKTKLELTWIGKDRRPRLEPRILLEDLSESRVASARRGDDIFDNVLIHGDNLLALKALESDFSGKVKCIYIDPPFNTQQAFEHYEDGLEHSLWLALMRERIEHLHRLLSPDGSLFVHIDDNELAYLMVVCDEIFGRSNRIGVVTFKQSSVSGPKVVNPGLVTTASYVLYYAKNKSWWRPNKVHVATSRDKRYGTFVENRSRSMTEWRFSPLAAAFKARHPRAENNGEESSKLDRFVLANAESVVRLARIDPADVSEETRVALQKSIDEPGTVTVAHRAIKSDVYFYNGEQLLFYSTKVRVLDGKRTTAQALSNIWDDLLSNNLHKEGGIRFPGGKKPEALVKRILELATGENDLVLDSFAGSGTTGAVAHKMKRRWIMVELGEQARTHIKPRLSAVIDGTDASGVTTAVGWKGGGGYRYYRLAPSLMEKDPFGQWVISKTYNAEMLAEAMCKHFGFAYEPSPEHYWMQGSSSETDYIYVTTNSLTHEQLRVISEEVGPERSLLVCCRAFQGANVNNFSNLTVRKIPGAVLDRCEWGKDDYSLRIASLPVAEDAPEADPRLDEGVDINLVQPSLFEGAK